MVFGVYLLKLVPLTPLVYDCCFIFSAADLNSVKTQDCIEH